MSAVRVEFDHDGDGDIDGSTVSDANGHFVYDPTGLPAGAVTLQARTSIDSPATGTPIVSSWSSLTITITLAAAPGVHFLALTQDQGTATVPTWTTDWPEIQGHLASEVTGSLEFGSGHSFTPLGTPPANPALAGVLVEIDKDGDSVVDQTVRTGADGTFQRYLTGVSVGTHTVRLRAVITDPEQGTASASAWSSVTFEVVARASVVPVIASPQLVTVDAQGQRIAPTIAGTVTGPLAAGAYVDISVDGTGDTPDITLVVGADGTYRYAPPSLSGGSHTVRVRVRTYDSQTRSTVSTGWQSATVTKAASAGPTLIIGGTSPSAPSSSSGSTTTSGSSVASPEQAVGSAVGAIQGAVTGAQGNLTTALSSTISPLASAAGLTAADFDWKTPDIQLELHEDPLPPAPYQGLESLPGANIPDLDMLHDPAFLAAVEAADEEYEGKVRDAAQLFKNTVQPVLDEFKRVKAEAERDRHTATQDAELIKARDTAWVEVQAAARLILGGLLIGPAANSAGQQVADLKTALDADLAAISLQLYQEIYLDARNQLIADIDALSPIYQQRLSDYWQTVQITADPNTDAQGYASQMQAAEAGANVIQLEWVNAVQAEQVKYAEKVAKLEATAAKDSSGRLGCA